MKTPLRTALVIVGAVMALPATALAAGQPSVPDNKTSGIAEFWMGYAFLSEELQPTPSPFDDSYLGLGGELHLNLPAGGGLNFQIDLQSESGFSDATSNNYTGSVLGGAHLSWRNPESWLFGGFAGIGNGFNAFEDTVTAWLAGAEAQLYLSDWTFYAQAGYMDGYDVNTGTDEAYRDAWFGRGVARFFLESNVMLEGELSYSSGENDIDADAMDVWGWGMRYQRAIPSMDSSLFIAYQGNFYDAIDTADDDQLTEHMVKLGLSFAFGVEGQKYIDRHGATLDLPMVTRWSAYGVDVLD